MKVVDVKVVFTFDDGSVEEGVFDEENNSFYIPDEEKWIEFDENGNLIHEKYRDGFEEQREYYNDGSVKKVLCIDAFGSKNLKEFDENRNLIHYKDEDNREEYWQEYDDNDNMIHYKDSRGKEYSH